MLRKLFNKLISWLKEIWTLFEIIDDVVPAGSASPSIHKTPASQPKQTWLQAEPALTRHRYIELEGYAENLRIDQHGRYDLRQLARFAENFVWVSPEVLDEFLDDTMDYDHDFAEGQRVTWLNKADCIEFCYHQYSPLADLL